MGLTVAVTGPTGDIGISAVTALEREPAVENIVGMARRPFDVSSRGWVKTTYHQGDIGDREAVDAFVAQADVVIHLAFIIMGSREESARINLQGTRNVFEATVAAERPRRLVYTSSVAAYGYHSDNPVPLTEDVPARGSAEHYYSAQKAACEAALAEITEDSSLEVFILRPCIVAGPEAPALADAMPWNQTARPGARRGQGRADIEAGRAGSGCPSSSSSTTTTSRQAIALAATTPAPPGAYNLAGDGVVTVSEVAEGAGWPAGAGSRRCRLGGVGGDRAGAVRAFPTGMAAYRADVGGDGHHQGQDATRLATGPLFGGDPGGAGVRCVTPPSGSFGCVGHVTARRRAQHVTADRAVTRPETLVVEEPLEIRVNGAPIT